MSFTASLIVISVLMMGIAYILGSINFAIIYTRIFAHTDVREHGSKNAGMTNVLRTAGKIPAALTLICDFSKGAIAVFIGKYLANDFFNYLAKLDRDVVNPLYFSYIAGLFCLLGHIYPVFFGFRGGKGVSSLAGIMLIIDWRVLLCALGIFIVVFLLSQIVSLSSLSAVFSAPFFAHILYNSNVEYSYNIFGLSQKAAITTVAFCFAFMVIVMHRANIVRLIKGQEKRIKIFRRRKKLK